MVIGLFGDSGTNVAKHVEEERRSDHEPAPILHLPTVELSALGRVLRAGYVTRTLVQVNHEKRNLI